MAKLEPWQRYRKASPCPVCGGYGAYRPENRCKGFRSLDGFGAWCSTARSLTEVWFDALGCSLWYHPYQDWEQAEGEGEARKESKSQGLKSRYKHFLWKGSLRHQAREQEAKRPPTVRDFG